MCTIICLKVWKEKWLNILLQELKKIISVNPNKDYTLTLSYDDGSIRLYDCKAFLLKDTVFEPFMEGQFQKGLFFIEWA